MSRRIIITMVLLMTFSALADWPPIVDSKRDIAALPPSTLKVRARGLSDADISALKHLPLLEHLDFGAGRKALDARITDKGLASLAAPAWLLIPQSELMQISTLRPDLKIDSVIATKSGFHLLAARVEKR